MPPPAPSPPPPRASTAPRARAVSPTLEYSPGPWTSSRSASRKRCRRSPATSRGRRSSRTPPSGIASTGSRARSSRSSPSSGSWARACPRNTAAPAPTSSRYVLVLEELSRADAGVGVTVAVHTSAATLPILGFGTDEQRARFVPPLARGEHLGAFALTEPESGSDAGALRTRAEPEGDGWRDHRGEAVDHERALRRHVPALRAHRRGRPPARAASVHSSSTPTRSASRATRRSSGLNSSVDERSRVEGALVGRDRLLHEENKGFRVAMQTLDGGRIGIAAQAVGIAQAAYESRASTRRSATRSASASPSTRRSSSSSPTWRRRSTPRGCSSIAPPR